MQFTHVYHSKFFWSVTKPKYLHVKYAFYVQNLKLFAPRSEERVVHKLKLTWYRVFNYLINLQCLQYNGWNEMCNNIIIHLFYLTEFYWLFILNFKQAKIGNQSHIGFFHWHIWWSGGGKTIFYTSKER